MDERRLHLPTPQQLTELRRVAEGVAVSRQNDMSILARNKIYEMAPVPVGGYGDEELAYKTHTVGLHAVRRAMGGVSAEAWEMKCIAADHFTADECNIISRTTYSFGWSEDETRYATRAHTVLRNGQKIEAAKGLMHESLPGDQIDNIALWSLQSRLNQVTTGDCDMLIADVAKVLQHN